MAFPQEISNASYILPYDGLSPQNATVYGGKVYQFTGFTSGGLDYITVHRSSDLIVWTELDTGNRVQTTGVPYTFGLVVSGQYAYVAHNATMLMSKFDFVTETWQATVATGGPTVADNVEQIFVGQARVFVVRKTNGDFVIYYQTSNGGPSAAYDRAAYVTLSGTTWSSPASLSGYSAGDAKGEGSGWLMIDNSDRSYFFWGVKDGAARELWHRSLASDGTLDTATKISDAYFQDTSSPFANFRGVGRACVHELNGKLYMPFMRDPGTPELSLAVATSGANPSWATEKIPSTANGETFFPRASLTTDFWGAFASAHPQARFFGITSRIQLTLALGDRNYLNVFAQFGTVSTTDIIVFIRRKSDSGSSFGAGIAYAIRSAAGAWSGPFELYRSPTGGGGAGLSDWFTTPLDICAGVGGSGARYSIV